MRGRERIRAGGGILAYDRAHGPTFAGRGSPSRERGALVHFRQCRAHRVVLIRLDKCLDPRVILVTRLDGDEVAIRVVADCFRCDAVVLREIRFERPVGIDDCGVEIVDRAADDAGVKFLDLDVLRVLGDVRRRGQDAGVGFSLMTPCASAGRAARALR